MEVVAEVAVSGEARVFFLGWQSWSLSGTPWPGQPGPEPRGDRHRAHIGRQGAAVPSGERGVVQADGAC